jgi:hypothetical protein
MEEIYYFYDWVLNYEQNLRNYEYFQNQHDRI